ncbi:hypothetical protein GCM10010116_20550 [Microbispora rosea subsp. aerata]|nr:hypothetical protein [Microbispora rosea]GGO10219.1 hypothetical protein GCM10010116_20550 [Microbispora rosea subsp. aerata]GIH53331.1 hypothetical protein Mro02_02450 [Microbispora rosea subsp. aerata]GLJ83011.1 hypothetical protein GCM10017588_17370 [Microbispora rosea subsp. aerata]
MLFVELLVPKGVFDEHERRRIAERLTGRRLLSDADGEAAPVESDVIELFNALTHVVVREEEIWSVGGRLSDASEGPRYIVNVIAGMWGKEISENLISRITAELGEMEGNPEPRAVVNVIPLPEGGYGLYGRAQRMSDVPQLMNKTLRRPRTDSAGGQYAYVIETRDNQERHWSWIVDFGDVIGRGVEDGLPDNPGDFARTTFDDYLNRLVERAPGAVEFFLWEDEDDTQWRIQVWDVHATGYDQINSVPEPGDRARRQYPLALRAERIPPQLIVTFPGDVVRNRLQAKQLARRKALEVGEGETTPRTGRDGEASPGPQDAA